jgi:hypothetical protein
VDSLSPLFAAGAGLAFIAFWFGLAVWIGLTAERRGYNALIWFGFAIFATPLLALVLLALITPRGGRDRMR